MNSTISCRFYKSKRNFFSILGKLNPAKKMKKKNEKMKSWSESLYLKYKKGKDGTMKRKKWKWSLYKIPAKCDKSNKKNF